MPDRDRDSTNILRASVLDVFRDLGALDDNSVVKAWILDGPNSPITSIPDLSDLEDIDSPVTHAPRTKVSFSENLRAERNVIQEESDSGSETDTGRQPRSAFRTAISRPFQLRSKSSTRSKSKTRGKSPSSGYETDEGYNSASSSKRRNVLGRRKKSKSRPTSPTNQDIPPVPSLDQQTASGGRSLTRFFRAPKSPRKTSHDLTLTPQSSKPSSLSHSRVTTPELTHTPSKTSLSSASPASSDQHHPTTPPQAARAIPEKDKTGGSKRLSFVIPSASVPTVDSNLGARRRKSSFNLRRLSLKPSHEEPSEHNRRESSLISKSAPSSPFLLVAPYGGEDAFVDGGSGHVLAEPINDSTKSSARESVTSLSGPVVPVSISKTLRRQSQLLLSSSSGAAPDAQGQQKRRRLSLDSAIHEMEVTAAPTEQERPNLMRGRTVAFPVKPVLALPVGRSPLVPPPRLLNPDASRFGEMDLDD